MFDFSTAQLPFFNRSDDSKSQDKTSSTAGDSATADSEASNQQDELSNQAASRLEQPWHKRLKRWQLALLVGTLILLATLATIGIYTYVISQQLISQTQAARTTAMEGYTAFRGQNLPAAEEKLTSLDSQLTQITNTYNKLGFYRYVPVAKTYYLDGEHGLKAARAGLSAGQKAVTAVTPYADVLGFTGEGSFTGGTTEDRIRVILETLNKVTPVVDEMTADLKTMDNELNQIDPADYPENLAGRPVRQNIIQGQELSNGVVTAATEYRPVIEQIPYVAGANGETKKYLILFQNDNELRPTGGFLTAYAIINVTDGKVEAEQSGDIYDLDQRFNEQVPIPEKLGRYLTTEQYWHLRDMNISPDFKSSMETFFANYQQVPGEPAEEIDGIIAVDTEFLTNLLTVLGPVEVPGYGTFSAETDERCDCPQIIYVLSEIITRPTPFIRENRKGILGPLMRAILTKAYAAPQQQWPELFRAGFMGIQNRHAQFYFMNQETQQAAEAAEAAGRLEPIDNSDFLAIINANLGGAKSNLYTDYEVEQTVSAPENGYINKTVEITYRNNREADNCNLEAGQLCLNSTLDDWTRIYVPEGSELIEAQGFTEAPETYDEAGFTVFDGFFVLEPLAQAKLTLTYRVPYQNQEEYQLHLWKQGGVESYQTLIDVVGGQEKLTIVKDTNYQTNF